MTKAEKRAEILLCYMTATCFNNENYYMETFFDGIPDGDNFYTAYLDLKNKFYDDCLNEMLKMYHDTFKKHSKSKDPFSYVNSSDLYKV